MPFHRYRYRLIIIKERFGKLCGFFPLKAEGLSYLLMSPYQGLTNCSTDQISIPPAFCITCELNMAFIDEHLQLI